MNSGVTGEFSSDSGFVVDPFDLDISGPSLPLILQSNGKFRNIVTVSYVGWFSRAGRLGAGNSIDIPILVVVSKYQDTSMHIHCTVQTIST